MLLLLNDFSDTRFYNTLLHDSDIRKIWYTMQIFAYTMAVL